VASLDGRTLGHFRVERLIGSGGMGAVYEAVDTKLERHVALKVLVHQSANTELARKRFLREARLAAKLTHPNIATVFEVGEFESDLYIVMELLEGQSLRRLLMNQRLGTSQTLLIARDVARALARAHTAGVTHRDIKPENVFITMPTPNVMQAKVLDFGLARQDASTPRVMKNQEHTATDATKPGEMLGTPGYWSPEQAGAGEVGARSDIFSFGLVLYEMLTGRQAFRANNTVTLVLAVTRQEPDPVRKYVPNVSPQIEALLARCIAKDPARRFADGSELLKAVDEVIAATARISSHDLDDPTVADASGPPVMLVTPRASPLPTPKPLTPPKPVVPPIPKPIAKTTLKLVPVGPSAVPQRPETVVPYAPTPGPVVRDGAPNVRVAAAPVDRLRLLVAIGAGIALAGLLLIAATVLWGRSERANARAAASATQESATSEVASAAPPSLAVTAPPAIATQAPDGGVLPEAARSKPR
jgi:serine/threonine protein kinase